MTKPAVLVPGVAAILALAACSGDADPEQDDSADAVGRDKIASGTSSGAASRQGPEDAGGAGIPEAIQGSWGLKPTDCTGDRGVALGLLRVGPKMLEFYESGARLVRIEEREPNRIRARFDFSGEGEQWTMDMELGVINEGHSLIRRDFGPDAMPGSLRYERCPPAS